MEFFTADIHFCDLETMQVDNRPFKTIKQYDNFIINDFNKTAKKGDTIYVVGDLLDCDGPNSTEWLKGLKLIKRIKADVVLIMGNNEQRVVKLFFDGDFQKFVETCKFYGIKEVYKSLDIECWGRKFHLVHQIADGHKNKFNLFGHTHLCAGLYNPYGLCVSTDLNHFRLYTKEILEGYIERKKEYWEQDPNVNYINPNVVEIDGKVTIKKQTKKYLEYLKNDKF